MTGYGSEAVGRADMEKLHRGVVLESGGEREMV